MSQWIDPRRELDCQKIKLIPFDEQTVEFLEARDETVRQICLGLGLSPAVLGVKKENLHG